MNDQLKELEEWLSHKKEQRMLRMGEIKSDGLKDWLMAQDSAWETVLAKIAEMRENT